MSIRINVHYQNKFIYDILIEKDFSRLSDELLYLNKKYNKICIVTDTNVEKLYLNKIKEELCQYPADIIEFIFDAGEASKNLDTVEKLYEVLIESKFERSDLLIALGGGVVGDLTGFTASTYVRGIDFIQIPTSLLAQVDSSIGGKTGVDFKQYKNMVGAFHHPKLVFINLDTLNTLPKREYLSGLAEVVKHGLIKDEIFYEWLISHKDAIKSLDMGILEKMIMRSCLIKKNVVENDFYEKGDRALLNFGHTIGHAVEKLMNFSLLHGECVSIGIAYALELSYIMHYITSKEKDRAINLLKDFELPIDYVNLDKKDILNTILFDKKMESGVLKFILLASIGNSIIDRSISLEQISNLLE